MSVEERAREAAENAIKAAEVARRAGDKHKAIAATSEGLFLLTEAGRLFLRTADPRHYNDGRTTVKFMWAEVTGPLE